MPASRPRIFNSGDWYCVGAWLVATVLGSLLSILVGLSDAQRLMVRVDALFILVAAGWIVGRQTGAPLLRLSVLRNRIARRTATVVAIGVWPLGGLIGLATGWFAVLDPTPFWILLLVAWTLTLVVGRAVDRRAERVATGTGLK